MSAEAHRAELVKLRERAQELIDEAYKAGAPWQLRDVAVPLVVDLVGELGAVVLELGLREAFKADVTVERD